MCQGLGRKNKHDILKTDRMTSGRQDARQAEGPGAAGGPPVRCILPCYTLIAYNTMAQYAIQIIIVII